jgi:microcystin degradation protein MlrC
LTISKLIIAKKMKNNSIILLALSVLISCSSNSDKLPRIAICGLAIESSTFSPAQTTEDAFHAKMGDQVYTYYPFLNRDSVTTQRAQYFPALRGHALPGGIVTKEAYESLMAKMLGKLQENLPYDGVFFDIHGAMSVVGIDDPEGDMIQRVRKVVGEDAIISTSMDLHGNVSRRLAHQSDLITCYRMAPHEDAIESKKRALTNLLERLESGKGRPTYKAWIPVSILLPGEKTSTRIEPAKSLYAKVKPMAQKEGVLDAAIWVGYAWADEPRNHAVVMVTGDDKMQVKESAEELAQYFWDVREQFEFVAPVATLEECLEMALESDKKPFIISDMGDNPTAGGAGDVTWTLKQILDKVAFQKLEGPTLIYASIPGPKLVHKALEVGIGGEVDEFVGAQVDNRYEGPIKLKGIVEAVNVGDQHAEIEVVVRVGSARIIVTKKRKPYHHESDFTNLNLNPREADILVVKIGYLVPELYNMRGDWIMALTPGGVDQNLERLPYERIKRPIYPLDKDMDDPDLSARFIPLSNEQKVLIEN